MTRRWILALFVAVCAVQLAVPALMIRKYEATLARGRPFKVRCAPVDPADAFRGRYVWLSLEVPAPEGYAEGEPTWGKKMWALLEEGPDGFARAASIHDERPAEGDAVPVRFTGGGMWPVAPGQESPQLRFQLAIDRYYMPEGIAPQAETAYREHVARTTVEAWAAIRVLDGVAVIESLFVAGMPIEEFIALPPAERERLAPPEPVRQPVPEPASRNR